jgi:hypothetical protein
MQEANFLAHKEKQSKIMGPVDYLMVKFPGNKFSGEIVPALADIERRGIIRVIDLVFLLKDPKGKVIITEAKDLTGETARAYAALSAGINQWFYEGDVNAIAEALPNNSSAALLLYENLWAVKFKEALLNADAELIDMGRIDPEVIAEAQKLIGEGGM